MIFGNTLTVSTAGLYAQSARLRVVAENLANASITGSKPGADPYRRHTISFTDRADPKTGLNLVTVSRIGLDPATFPLRYQSSNPAASAQGYVKYPNVNSLVELMDMQQAQRSYNANLSVLNAARHTRRRISAMQEGVPPQSAGSRRRSARLDGGHG